jgi:hypothetical protein
MTKQTSTVPFLLRAWTLLLRRARTSLYQPFADPLSFDQSADVPPARTARILPFRQVSQARKPRGLAAASSSNLRPFAIPSARHNAARALGDTAALSLRRM